MSKPLIVIIGATGDLTKRKLIPALYGLFSKGTKFRILGVGRKDFSKKEFLKSLNTKEFIGQKKELDKFLKLIDYTTIDFSTKKSETLKKKIDSIDKQYECEGDRIFYLSLPPFLFTKSSDIIKNSGLLKGTGWKKIVFEKPFGHDLKSAKKLNEYVTNTFGEENTYRIDHYLGKELIQNIIVFRFANSIFEQSWNNKFIEHIQIIASEKLGVGTRAGYYESVGAIKDMIQSHLLQVLALIAMEEPKSLSAKGIRDEKVKIFKSLKPIKSSDIIIGQYDSGIIDKKLVPAYRQEKNIKPDSKTNTFACLKVFVNNKRWQGIPFYLKTGKRLDKHEAQINIVFKDSTAKLFSEKSEFKNKNVLTIKIQPEEGISIRFNTKPPGSKVNLQPVTLEYCHNCLFQISNVESYQTLLSDIIKGEQILFARWDGVENSWKFIDKVIALAKKKSLKTYKSGSTGPKEADLMLKKDGHEWFKIV